MARPPRPRGPFRYNKPPMTLDELVGRLSERGLRIPDASRAARYLRNICAHHGRLWNVGLGVYPAIPTSHAVSWPRGEDALPERSRKRLYPVLVSLQSVLDAVSPRSGWARRLHNLVSDRPRMNLAGMGVPENWAQDAFWSRHIP